MASPTFTFHVHHDGRLVELELALFVRLGNAGLDQRDRAAARLALGIHGGQDGGRQQGGNGGQRQLQRAVGSHLLGLPCDKHAARGLRLYYESALAANQLS
jgi:hypothetical protein